MKTITDVDFESIIRSTDKLIVVKFGAVWCPPCRAINPVIEEVATMYEGKAIVASIDVDDSPQTASVYGIRSIPTILFIKDGEVKEKVVGSINKSDLIAKIDLHNEN